MEIGLLETCLFSSFVVFQISLPRPTPRVPGDGTEIKLGGIARTKIKKKERTLAGWLSWLEHRHVKCNTVGSIPAQGT